MWAAPEAARETPENLFQMFRDFLGDVFFLTHLSGKIDASPNKYDTPKKETRDAYPWFHL